MAYFRYRSKRRKQLIGKDEKVRCPLCNKMRKNEDMTLDHIRPLDKGGHPHSKKNLQPACRWCNRKKANSWDGKSGYPSIEQNPIPQKYQGPWAFTWIPGLPKRHPKHDTEYLRLYRYLRRWETHGKNFYARE